MNLGNLYAQLQGKPCRVYSSDLRISRDGLVIGIGFQIKARPARGQSAEQRGLATLAGPQDRNRRKDL